METQKIKQSEQDQVRDVYDALEGNKLALGTEPQILNRNNLLSALGRSLLETNWVTRLLTF